MKYFLLFFLLGLIGAGVWLLLSIEEPPGSVNVINVETPAQTVAAWPPGIQNPLENRVPLPDSPNIALGKTATAGTQAHMRAASYTVDNSLTTFWESARLPAMFTLDLEDVYNIEIIAIALNPTWESRSQVFEILGSICGNDFFEIKESAVHFFTPNTANTVRIDINQTEARFVRLIFTANTATYTSGAQISEIMVFPY